MDDRTIEFNDNLPEVTVSELSNQVKFIVEENFQRIRVRGEISRPTKASSGHVYLTLKDENSVLDGVCWRGTVRRLSVQPEEGMEVVCTGKITTYPGRSKYQIIIEQLELAGEGALLKLLEERRKKFLKEGLFDQDRKLPLPIFPKTIGIITSSSGAVIRDILHRLKERFPVHVLVWPVLVQGPKAADEIASAIIGFNTIVERASLPRPDLLIVARGGGSLEDLWCFNEEVVVRAAATSSIPLISAVGHETDTTLIDFVSDLRAPTPTAAAEKAVLVRSELISEIIEKEKRLFLAIDRLLTNYQLRLDGLARGLGEPAIIIDNRNQRLDYLEDNLVKALAVIFKELAVYIKNLSSRLASPDVQIKLKSDNLNNYNKRLDSAGRSLIENASLRVNHLIPRLKVNMLGQAVENFQSNLDRVWEAGTAVTNRKMLDWEKAISGLDRILEASSFRRTLDKGFVLVRDEAEIPVSSKKSTFPGQLLELQFKDGIAKVQVDRKKSLKKESKNQKSNPQETLF